MLRHFWRTIALTSASGTPQKISPRSISSEVSQKNSSSQAAASSEVSQKVSPRVVRQLKTGPRYSDHTASSSNLVSKASKERSPKVADHRSPRSPASEGLQRIQAQARTLVGETLMQLETAKKTVEMFKSDGVKATEAYKAVASELDQSRAQVNFLEELVSKLKADISSKGSQNEEGEDTVKAEVNSAKLEVEQLRSALEAAEIRYNEERARSAEQIQNAFETVEKIKSVSSEKEAELESELRKSKYEIEELKANLMDKETELQGICEENEALTVKLESTLSGQREIELEKMLNKSKTEIENLKSSLIEKETHLQNISDENEKLKSEMNKGDKVNNEIESDIESARAGEREARMKISYMTEEVEKSNIKAARVAEQLEAAQAANAETEAELRRLKVQSDQWRKAAEAAAAMLSAGNNGQIMERTGSMDSHYGSPRTGKISSPYADDLDEDLMKKKNANMLRRFGVLWKKQQK
ncbi:hypothetical protein DH2020_021316 [Rehmannia glutinosa]|uniref:Interactor of constitutive active ROPs 3 n=1 Tax=Rehmannia glutinosa TaxID=99300 RepID=A0ABR0WD22_REHGL